MSLMSLEMGAPIDMSARPARRPALAHQELHQGLRQLRVRPPAGPHAPNDRIIREPVGVCALITPWNWPMNQVTLKTIPALLAGCTMVLKPSEIAPLSSLLFAEILHEAGSRRACSTS
jgi:aldehyde dehydrogenase (NAD+)